MTAQTPAQHKSGRPQDPTNSTRQRAYKARQLAAGLVKRELWVHPQDWPKIKEYAKLLALARKHANK